MASCLQAGATRLRKVLHGGPQLFGHEGEIKQPQSTPVLADSVVPILYPMAADGPPLSLIYGADRHAPNVYRITGSMNFVSIPRHGKRAGRLPERWPNNKPLPGANHVRPTLNNQLSRFRYENSCRFDV